MADFRDLDRLLQKYVDDGLPNASCVIARKGEILYENYFGWADKENGIRLEAKHVFRQASLTKIAMYATAMMLYEQGKFLMTDPLYEYFPEYRDSTKLVTMPNGSLEVVPTEGPILVKHIFNMTCGLPYEMIVGGVPVQHHPTALAMAREMKELREKGYFTLRDQIRAASRVPLAFEPGTRFLYGFASELTAGLLEALCGKPAELVIREMLFEPLGMDSSANFLFGDLESTSPILTWRDTGTATGCGCSWTGMPGSTMASRGSSAGPAAPEPGRNPPRRRASPSSICTIYSPIWRSTTISGCGPWPTDACEFSHSVGRPAIAEGAVPGKDSSRGQPPFSSGFGFISGSSLSSGSSSGFSFGSSLSSSFGLVPVPVSFLVPLSALTGTCITLRKR